jgi:outer membrane receptor protein involved in Fe transport
MRRLSTFVLSSVSVAALTASPAFAQAGAPVEATPEVTAETEQAAPASVEPTNAAGQPTSEGEIVVTGSRIRRNNFNTASPVTIVTRDDQVLAGSTGTAETLQSASITSGTSQISSAFLGFLSEGGQGANTVGLRGLGSQRTLVLLNGRRLAPAGVGSQLVAADLNVLPTSIVQRIEVLREGASAVYGSDAIAGVINVITDTKINGVVLDAGTDLPLNLEGGAGRSVRGSITAGKTFDRGYIMGSLEYQQRNGVRFADNPNWRCPRALYKQNGVEVGQVDPATGQLACFAFGPNGSAGSGIASGYGLYGVYFGGPYNNIYTYGRISFRNGDINNTILVNDFFNRPIKEETQLQSTVISPRKTYTAYLSGAYELGALGDAELYGEVLYTRRGSKQRGASQFSIDTLQLDPNIEIYGGTYYATGAPITNYAPPSGVLPNYVASPFFPISFLTQSYANRFNPFIMPDQLQKSSQKVEFWRANGGLRGKLGMGDWEYDANIQASRTRANEKLRNPTVETASNVLMTTVAPAGTPAQFITRALPGQVQAGVNFTCQSNVTAGAYNGGQCVPLNIFDPAILIGGDIPQALYDYLYVPQVQRTRFNQETLSLIFNGTVLELPAGPLKAAVGLEYRHDKIRNVPSADAQAGLLYNRTNEGITAGSDNVKEAYAEFNIPVIRDKPFFHNLELEASGRFTDYKSYGSGFVYRLNGQWSPVEALRFRGSLGTNFRAPNLFEQFVNNQTGFFGGSADPCDSFGSTDPTSNTYINCLAELTPILGSQAAALNFFNASSILVNTTGGRDSLKAEKAKSYGFGGVFTMPRHIADFTFAVDYFHTVVKDEVSTLGLTILNLCYNEDPGTFPGGNYCPYINGRNPLGTAYPGTIISFQNPYLNLSQQVASGIDFNARFATPLFGNFRLIAQGQATRMLHQQLEVFQGSGLFEYNGTLGYPGFGSGPKWTANLDTRIETGPWTFRWGVEYIGRSSAEGLVTQGLYPPNGGTGVPGQPYTEDLVAEAYWEHGVSVRYQMRNFGQITVGVKNLFDEKPPTISDSQDPAGQYFRIANYFGGGPYDYLGRSVFVNITKTF